MDESQRKWRRRCNHCANEIAYKAIRKGAHFCSSECRQQDRYDQRTDDKAMKAAKQAHKEAARVQIGG